MPSGFEIFSIFGFYWVRVSEFLNFLDLGLGLEKHLHIYYFSGIFQICKNVHGYIRIQYVYVLLVAWKKCHHFCRVHLTRWYPINSWKYSNLCWWKLVFTSRTFSYIATNQSGNCMYVSDFRTLFCIHDILKKKDTKSFNCKLH